ncbi:hypothetical protein H4R18_002098 [Coemansia javaensis]|uniref:Uncharacterized protein n=1 Tax=Coemansia javaensis TaxID=2761396 RepID=A0A9W8HFF2_9FUNG|nr:hypothetical protein H4R18_002098 [Coemansia javaensis]
MAGAWVHFSGVPAGSDVHGDVQRLAGGRAVRIELGRAGRGGSVAGRFEVASAADARSVVEAGSYSAVGGSTVRLWLGPELLAGCRQVVLEGIPPLAGGEVQLHEYCRRFGLVCKIHAEKGTARVWLDSEHGAHALVDSIKTGGFYGTRPQAYIAPTDSEVIVLDGDSDAGAATAARKPRGARAAPQPPPPPPPAAEADASAERRANAARKSTGKRRVAFNQPSGRQGKVLRVGASHIQHPPAPAPPPLIAAPLPPPKVPLLQDEAEMELDSAEMELDEPKAAAGGSGGIKHVRNIMDMTPWRAKAPFIYDFIYRRTPEQTGGSGDYCLSMAWCEAQQPGTVNCYLSLGNSTAATVVRDWVNIAHTSEDASSSITMSAFDIHRRGHAANIKSLLGAFNSSEVSVLHKNQKKDDNRQAISSLRLHDEGRILLGCTMQSVVVWTSDAIRQKETLLLLDDIDGVYDVGGDYVVANSSRGEMGVWRAGSRNYMWRYNDTRRFRGATPLVADAPRITALQITADGQGAYVGDSLGRLSHCDLRAPHIERLASSGHRGTLRCIELAGSHGILTGTYDGRLALLDSRFARAAGGDAAAVREYRSPAGCEPVTTMRVCPHNPAIFACAVGATVCIYDKEPLDLRDPLAPLLFSHEAHQTPVMDFCWHPDREFMYTIGSVELGVGRGSSEIQIWRPADDVLQ